MSNLHKELTLWLLNLAFVAFVPTSMAAPVTYLFDFDVTLSDCVGGNCASADPAILASWPAISETLSGSLTYDPATAGTPGGGGTEYIHLPADANGIQLTFPDGTTTWSTNPGGSFTFRVIKRDVADPNNNDVLRLLSGSDSPISIPGLTTDDNSFYLQFVEGSATSVLTDESLPSEINLMDWTKPGNSTFQAIDGFGNRWRIFGDILNLRVAAPVTSVFDFNIDFAGTTPAFVNKGVPDDMFGGAASQPGRWNTINAAPGTTTLVDLAGNPTASSITLSADSGAGFLGTEPTTETTDTGRLLFDNFQSGGDISWSISITGLDPGVYDVYIYAPNNASQTGSYTVEGSAPFATMFGSGTTDVLADEINFRSHPGIAVVDGTLNIDSADTTNFRGLSGLQLVLMTSLGGDSDGDGIADDIDTLPIDFSDHFTNGPIAYDSGFSATMDGSTFGRIDDRGGNPVTIENTAGNGVQVVVGTDTTTPAQLALCDNMFQAEAVPGSEATLYCGSLGVIVTTGEVLVEVGAIQVEIPTGSEVLLDEQGDDVSVEHIFGSGEVTMTLSGETTPILVLIPSDATVMATADIESPGYVISNESDGGQPITIIVDGEEMMFEPGDVFTSNDFDDDSVTNEVDLCPDTVIPESVPTKKLKPNRWALVNGDVNFDTVIKKGKTPKRSYAIHDTAGCSCEQIIEAQGLDKGHLKHGCSNGAMDNWVDLVNL